MRVLAAVLILTALGIGMFPRVLQYRSARELASTSARSEQSVAGWPYPQADEAFAAAGAYNKRLAESGQPVIGEAEDPLAELYNNNQSDSSDGSGSRSRRAQAPLAMVTRIPLAPKTRNTSVCWILAMA